MNKCEVCTGIKRLRDTNTGKIEDCPFCNGTGESTPMSKAIMRHHICNCIATDRKNCSICNRKCHHSTNNNKLILAGGGYQ